MLNDTFIQKVVLKEKFPDGNAHPFNVPAVKQIESLRFHKNVTFLVGENGSGKSTVLESIAVAAGFNPEGGNISTIFSTVESVSALHDYLRLVRGYKRPKDGFFLRAESFFNYATFMDNIIIQQSFNGKRVHSHSHGEAFITLLTKKFKGNGIYILDEPEAALSPSRQMVALRAIHEHIKNGSQFIIATHSPILLAYPECYIYQFSEDGIKNVDYEETDNFLITKDFLKNYKRRLHQLLDDDTY